MTEWNASRRNLAQIPRPFYSNERDLLTWAASLFAEPDKDHFLQQIAAGRVVREDDGGLSIEVPTSVPPVLSKDGLNLTYADADGVNVEFLIALVDGRLSWIDRYRIPGGDPIIKVPLVGQVHVSAE